MVGQGTGERVGAKAGAHGLVAVDSWQRQMSARWGRGRWRGANVKGCWRAAAWPGLPSHACGLSLHLRPPLASSPPQTAPKDVVPRFGGSGEVLKAKVTTRGARGGCDPVERVVVDGYPGLILKVPTELTSGARELWLFSYDHMVRMGRMALSALDGPAPDGLIFGGAPVQVGNLNTWHHAATAIVIMYIPGYDLGTSCLIRVRPRGPTGAGAGAAVIACWCSRLIQERRERMPLLLCLSFATPLHLRPDSRRHRRSRCPWR